MSKDSNSNCGFMLAIEEIRPLGRLSGEPKGSCGAGSDPGFDGLGITFEARLPDGFGSAGSVTMEASLESMKDQWVKSGRGVCALLRAEPGVFLGTVRLAIKPGSVKPGETYMARIWFPGRPETCVSAPVLIGEGSRALPALDAVFAEINGLVGLESVKESLFRIANVQRHRLCRQSRGLPTFNPPLHSMFLGSPGTGKTTVARLLGRIMRALGILSDGSVLAVTRTDLLTENYGGAERKVQELLEKAEGKVVLIDEAYSLFKKDDPRDPGSDVLNALMGALDERRDCMLVLAGYPGPMMDIFGANAGMRSRFPESNILRFDDYSADELMEIAQRLIESKRYSNADSVRLWLNGSLAGEKAVGRASQFLALFTIPYRPGILRAESSSGLSQEIATAGEPAAIRLTPDRENLIASGQDLAYVLAEIVDKDGVPVPDCDVELSFSVEGEGALVATGSADVKDTRGYHRPVRRTSEGRAMAVVKSASAQGIIRLTASAPGLPAADVTISTNLPAGS